VSGNPSGRPKGLERRFRELVDEEELPMFLLNVIRDENERTRERLEAPRIYLGRGWGKAPQVVDLSANRPSNPFEDMTADDLAALVAVGKQVMEAQRAAEAAAVPDLPERASGSPSGDG
jgi:hypothetical protein